MPSTPAVSDASTAALIPIGAKAASVPVIEIKRPVFLIGGRREAVKLHLESSTVSKLHCCIVLNAWGCYVHDLGSRTGTIVNGQPVVDQDLNDGDELQIGRFRFKFRPPKRTTPKPTPLPAADLVVSGLDLPLTAHKRVLTIGRRAGSDVEFEEKSVSNLHALIVEQDGRRLLRDLGSRTGTWIGDHPIHQEILPDGGGFRIGRAVLTLTSRRAAAELPLDEPIPLSEAPRPAMPGMATPGIVPTAGLGTLDLGAVDFAELDDAGPVVVPADDDLSLVPRDEPHAAPEDDLAALRRNWQTTPRPTAEIPPVLTPPLPAAAPAAMPPVVIPPVVIPSVPPLAPAARAPIPSIPHRPAVPKLDQPAAPITPADLPVVEHLPAPAGPPVIPVTIPELAEAPTIETPNEKADDAAPDDAAPGVALDLAPAPADVPDLDVLAEAPAETVDVADHEAEPTTEAEELAIASETLGQSLPPARDDAPDLDVLAEVEAEPAAETAAIVDAGADDLALDPDAPEAIELDAIDVAGLAPEAKADAELDANGLVLDTDAPAVAEDKTADIAAANRFAVSDEAKADGEAVDEPDLVNDQPTPTAAEAIADDLILADGAEPTPPLVAAGPVAVPTAEVPAADLPAAESVELERSDRAATAAVDEILVADGAAPAEPLVADEPADDVATVEVAPASADVAPVDADLEPLDLADLELVLDADAPAVAETPVDVDALRPDPDAPALADGIDVVPAEADADAVAAEDAAAIAETSTAGVVGLESAAVIDDVENDAEVDVVDAAAVEDIDVAEAEAIPVAGSDETDVPWPTEAAIEAAAIDLVPPADKVDLAADADFTDAEPSTASAAIVPTDVDLSDQPTPAEAAAETVVERVGSADSLVLLPSDTSLAPPSESGLPPGEREVAGLVLDDAGLASAIGAEVDAVDELHNSVAPGLADDAVADPASADHGVTAKSPVIEEPTHAPDLVRITDDVDDEDPDDATALAVDLGLVLDDDIAPSEIAPAAPVDVDLSRLGARPSGTNGQVVGPTPIDEAPHEDVFDADSADIVETADAPRPPARPAPTAKTPAAEAPKKQPPKDEELSGPYGGSLSDLMPSGPPLLGGSFMSLPPMGPTSPLPSIPARGRPRRVGFGGEPTTPAKRGPFSAQRTIADAIDPGSAVDDDDINLAPPPPVAPSADAFGVPLARPTTAAPLEFGRRNGVDTTLPAVTQRPRGTIRPVLPAEATYASQPGSLATPVSVALPAGPTDAELIDRARLHKKRVRRVIACVLVMIVLIGGAAWGVLYFLPPTARVDALINFENLDRVSPEEQQLLRTRMNDLLTSESVRQDAITLKPASVDNGFLASPKQVFDAIDRDPKIRWQDRSTLMRLRVHSLDKENDIARVRALGQAMVKTGDADRGKSGDLAAAVRNYSDQIARKNQELADLNDQIQALKQAKAGRPDAKDLSALNAEYLAAEQALTTIKSRRQELDASVERLKKPAVAAPSTGPAIDPITADQELASLTAELSRVQQAVIKPTPVATEERKQLDAAFKELEEQLAAVQDQKANPALVAYANKIGRGFKQVRDMTEQLFRRQDGQRQRLADLKAKMSENLQALTQQRLENDAELKKLRDGVELLTRQFNAAMASGETEPAKKKELDLRVAQVKVAEAEDKYKNQDDPVYTPAIQSLQQFIDQQEAETRADRKNVEDRLVQLQSDFMRDAPDTGNLPADQKQLAENIQKKLTAMTEARRATAAAEEKALAEQAKTEEAANAAAADLRVKVAARRQDVLAAARARQAEQDETTRRQRLADAQAELTGVRQQELAAAHRLTDAQTSIESAERQKRVDAQGETDLNAKLAARDNVERDRRTAQYALAEKQSGQAKLIVPDREVEVHSADDPDRRPMVFATVAGTSVVLLLIPILLNLMALAREAQLPYAHLVAEIDVDAEEGFAPLMDDDAVHADQKALPEPARS